MEFLDHLPGLFWRFSVLKQVQVTVLNHAFIRQELEVNDSVPVLFAVQDDRNLLHPARLPQRQGREEFIQRSKTTWETDQRFGA